MSVNILGTRIFTVIQYWPVTDILCLYLCTGVVLCGFIYYGAYLHNIPKHFKLFAVWFKSHYILMNNDISETLTWLTNIQCPSNPCFIELTMSSGKRPHFLASLIGKCGLVTKFWLMRCNHTLPGWIQLKLHKRALPIFCLEYECDYSLVSLQMEKYGCQRMWGIKV